MQRFSDKNRNNIIVSLSGGKDSTAMLLMMIEREEPIDSIIFFDTGWEFPQMYDHIDLLEKRIGMKIWRLHPRTPFEYSMCHRPIVAKKGLMKGKVYKIGIGWPSIFLRWCTRQKIDALHYFTKNILNPIHCIGLAFDEKHRIKNSKRKLLRTLKDRMKIKKRYPLVEWKIKKIDALQYCYDKDYHWDGLYKYFGRVSCFCCPLQRIGELRNLRKYYPDLWQKMLDMDNKLLKPNYGFRDGKTVKDLDKRFYKEDCRPRLSNLGLK